MRNAHNRGLIWVLVGLTALATGLVAAIVIVNMLPKQESQAEVVIDENTEEIIKTKVAEAGDDVELIIKIYQDYIDIASDEKKVGLLNERIFAIQKISLGSAYGEQIVNDAIEIDDILQTVSSAAQVVNDAEYYGFYEIAERYLQIVQERTDDDYNSSEGQG